MNDLTSAEFRAKVLAQLDTLRAMIAPEEEEWLNPTQARRLTGMSAKTLSGLANDKILDVRFSPGGHRRYSKRQLVEIAKTWDADG